ncbi:signal peptidase I [Streptomyces sp. NPDC085524]|uniref:signal peptidase I n=1 Tax=Streptomyces sp. NPDC085524 TaxID=3365728 RepID=UPI0037D85E87
MTEQRPGRRRGIWAIALLALGVVLIAGPIAFMVTQFTGVRTASNNMRPTVNPGELIVLKSDPSEVRRGDVVSYDPGGWGLSGPFLGRVVAVGGDHIAYANGDATLTLNGQPLDEPYVLNGAPGAGGVSFAVSVPQGRVFVLGDNRVDSADSRFHPDSNQGTLPVSAVIGVETTDDEVLGGGVWVVILGLAPLAGVCVLLVGIGLGIAALVVRRRKPVPAGPVWGAVHVDEP